MKFLKTIIRRVVISALREGVIKRCDASGIAGEQFLDRESFQHYGVASSPLPGGEGIMIGIGNVFYLIAEDDRRYRISLANGEVALYTDEGDKIHLQRGKIIEIKGQSKVIVNSPDVELGNGTLRRLIDERFITLINEMTWNVTNAVPAGPGPVIAGPGPVVLVVLADVATTKTQAS